MPAKTTAESFPLATMVLCGFDADSAAANHHDRSYAPGVSWAEVERAARNRKVWLGLASTAWNGALDMDSRRITRGIPSVWA